MKRRGIPSLLALVLLVASPYLSLADASTRNLRRHLNERELLEGTRIFARYAGPRGHRLAKRCARKIIRDRDDDDIIIFEGNGLCMEQLQRDMDIIDADFDNKVFPLGSSGDASSRVLEEIMPWGLEMIQADQLEVGDNEVTVCIVDSGIARDHPDFDSSMITGNDTVGIFLKWKWDTDVSGHGTHVAGIIAALAANDQGIAGAGKFRLHITRAIGDDGFGYESDIRNAVKQCVEAGAKVINLSVGGQFMSYLSNRYYTKAVEEHGVLLVAAAGNDGTHAHVFPASHPSVISVSAVYERGTQWIHSNQNSQVEFAAPGHNILSTGLRTSALQVNDREYTASPIKGTTQRSVTGELVFCEAGEDQCKAAKGGGICLMEKEGTSIGGMVEYCRKSGGAGIVIFGANDAQWRDWSIVEEIDFPAIGVQRSVGLELLEEEGEHALIGDVHTYVTKSGTSMASPHVCAAAALLWSHFGHCSNHQIRYALARTAENPEKDCDNSYGYGIVKTKDAYDWLQKNNCTMWDVPQLSQGGCTTL